MKSDRWFQKGRFQMKVKDIVRAANLKVGAVATKTFVTCVPEDDVQQALALMRQAIVRRLPVVGFGGTVLGIVSLNDILLAAGPDQGVTKRGRVGRIESDLRPSPSCAACDRRLRRRDMAHVRKRRQVDLVRPLSVLDVIFTRRSVRAYEKTKLDQPTIRSLIDAAVRAPTAMHAEPWLFLVIQDAQTLRRYSDVAKTASRSPRWKRTGTRAGPTRPSGSGFSPTCAILTFQSFTTPRL